MKYFIIVILLIQFSPIILFAWTRNPSNPLHIPGLVRYSDSCIDFAVADPSILWDSSDRKWKIWYATTRGKSFQATESKLVICYGESTDGKTWIMNDEPALSPGTDWDSLDVETPSVVYNPANSSEKRYIMVYSGYNKHDEYRIGVAFSSDGHRFTRIAANESPYGKAGLVLMPKEALPRAASMVRGVVADPDITLRNGVYHMWFSSFACSGSCLPSETLAWGVSHAISTDGIHWTPDTDNPVASLIDQYGSGGAQPSVVYDSIRGKWHLWFSNDRPHERDSLARSSNSVYGFRHAVSSDAKNWTIDYSTPPDFVWQRALPSEALGLVTGVESVIRNDSVWLYYTGVDSTHAPAGSYVDVNASVNSFGFSRGVFTLNSAFKSLSGYETRKENSNGKNTLQKHLQLTCEESSTISFYAPFTGRAVLNLYDISGKKVATLFDGNVTIGKNEVFLKRKHLNANGVYVARLRLNNETAAIRILHR
ncbi:MAG: hypothetical protein JNL74_00875 [Fibrobacteres bacterium]|nr:hypothetical protein [Fibrobacterota bacterium]